MVNIYVTCDTIETGVLSGQVEFDSYFIRQKHDVRATLRLEASPEFVKQFEPGRNYKLTLEPVK